MRTFLVGLVSIGLISSIFAGENDRELSGPTEVTIVSGVTETWDGVISGAGSIVLRGGGTLILTNPNNTFTGGVSIQSGIVKAVAEGCLGSGPLSVVGSESLRQFHFDAPNATFANEITLSGANSTNYDRPTILISNNVTFDGEVNLTSAHIIQIGITSADANKWSAYFNNKVKCGNNSLYLKTWGHFYFYDAVQCGRFDMGNAHSCNAKVHLYSPDNVIESMYFNSAAVECHANNVLGGARLYMSQSWSDVTRSRLNMNGFDQTIIALDFRTAMGQSYHPITIDGSRIESSAPATLTITGNTSDYATMHILGANVALEINATRSTFKQTLRYRQHETTQPMHIISGKLELVDGSTFKRVPELSIGENGAVLATATTDAFVGVRRLTINGEFDATASEQNQFGELLDSLVIGSTAKLKMPEGTMIRALSVTINGETFEHGRFLPADYPQLQGVTLVAKALNPGLATWTGNGADNKVSTAANWDVSRMALSDYGYKVRFAASNSAGIDQDVEFDGVELSTPSSSFVFEDQGGSISINTNGLTSLALQDGSSRQVVFEPEVQVVAAQTWAAATNHSFELEKGISIAQGAPLTIINGRYLWSGDNTIASALNITGATLKVAGNINTPNHQWMGNADRNGGGVQLNLFQEAPWQTKNASYVDNAVLVLSNATIEAGVSINCIIGTYPLQTCANTINEIRGGARHNSAGWGGIYLADNSELIFSGGFFDTSAATRTSGNGTVRFRNRPVTFNHSLAFNPVNGSSVFEVANNYFTYFALGYSNNRNCSSEFTVSSVMTNGVLVVGSMYSSSRFQPATAGTYKLQLNNTEQRVERLALYPKGEINGVLGSKITVFGNQTSGEGYLKEGGAYIGGPITGGVSLEMAGTGTLIMTNQAFASAGNITVSSGIVDFAQNATWANGTNVTIKGSGRLVLNHTTFGRQAKVFFSDNGVLAMAPGVVQRARECWVGDEQLPDGDYTYENAPAKLKVHISGGMLSVRGSGVILIVR